LLSMRKRTHGLGGTLQVISKQHEGTIVTLQASGNRHTIT
jgi:signal transduction histidine kinase